MAVLTVLCQGTSNSRDTATSGGHKLVISRIAELLVGVEGKDWLLLEGAGTEALRGQGVDSSGLAGVGWGAGVQANVDKAVAFVRRGIQPGASVGGKIAFMAGTVNLAGHSRGSITCYKIASALRQYPGIVANIFAIDPVPGNNGRINREMHDDLKLDQRTVRNSFLMLAESEHRLNFRPYVDALYCIGEPRHKFDTIPGTHGGINELNGDQHEAADIVLSRALKFLHENGSIFNKEAALSMLDSQAYLERYARMMIRIKKYKKYASVNIFRARTVAQLGAIVGNLATSSFNVDKHRIANVAGPKSSWGRVDAGAQGGYDQHHGLNLSDAIGRMDTGVAHAERTNRFFANQHHESLFQQVHPRLFSTLANLERRVTKMDLARFGQDLDEMAESPEKAYMGAYYAARVAP